MNETQEFRLGPLIARHCGNRKLVFSSEVEVLGRGAGD